MSKVVWDMAVSLDGFGTGLNQTREHPFGEAVGERLRTWMFGERCARPTRAIDPLWTRRRSSTGRVNMSSPGRGAWDEDWKGWWGDNPPYHGPVFVLTHHPREPVPMEGGTTFYFVTDGIESALAQAREAAGDGNVSIAGGAKTASQYLAAGDRRDPPARRAADPRRRRAAAGRGRRDRARAGRFVGDRHGHPPHLPPRPVALQREEVDAAALVARDEPAAVLGEGARRPPVVVRVRGDELAGTRIPDAQRPVPARRAGERAVARQRERHDLAAVQGVARAQRASREVPHLDLAGPEPEQREPAVGGDGDAVELTPGRGADQTTRRPAGSTNWMRSSSAATATVPSADSATFGRLASIATVPAAPSGRQSATGVSSSKPWAWLIASGASAARATVPLDPQIAREVADGGPLRERPRAERAVPTRGDGDRAGGVEGDRLDPAFVQRLAGVRVPAPDRGAGVRVPDGDPAVARTGHGDAGAHGDRVDARHVLQLRLLARLGVEVPDARRAVLGDRDRPRAEDREVVDRHRVATQDRGLAALGIPDPQRLVHDPETSRPSGANPRPPTWTRSGRSRWPVSSSAASAPRSHSSIRPSSRPTARRSPASASAPTGAPDSPSRRSSSPVAMSHSSTWPPVATNTRDSAAGAIALTSCQPASSERTSPPSSGRTSTRPRP